MRDEPAKPGGVGVAEGDAEGAGDVSSHVAGDGPRVHDEDMAEGGIELLRRETRR